MPSLLDLRRTAAAFVAVAMSAALIAFAFIISDSFRTQLQTSARLSVGDAAIVVQNGRRANSTEGALDDSLIKKLSALDGVASVRGAHWDLLWLDVPKQLRSRSQVVAQDVPTLTKFTTLSSGRLPKTTGEVAIDTVLAEQQGLNVGDTIKMKNDDKDDAIHSSSTIVGIVSAGADNQISGPGIIFGTTEQLQAMGAHTNYYRLYVNAKPGFDTSALMSGVSNTILTTQPSAIIQSRDEAIAQRTKSETAGGENISTILNLLAPVCAVVSIIVIATTFSTLVARQTRTIGLIRCIGSSRRQVMLAVLRTGLLTGLVGSVLGAALGTGLGAIAVSSGTFADL
ncbi:ABC transporter permease, partial [Actinomyces oris]